MGKAEVIESLFKLGKKPLKLYEYQKKWVNDESRFRIVNKSRQTGFSFICAAEALMNAMFMPRCVILFVSTGQRGAERLMKYVQDLWYSLPKKVRSEFKLAALSKQRIEFEHNGSYIESIPNNPATVRGYPATDIYLDEFAFFESEEKMWEAILPSISRTDLKRRVALISTPNGKLNTFYHIYEELAGEKKDVWSRHKVHHSDCYHLDVADIKKTMTDVQFRQEYCCQFIDAATSAIPYELIMSCIDPDLRQRTHMDAGHTIYAGIDFGKKRDSTVVVYFEKKMEPGDVEPTYVMKRMDMYTEPYNVQLPKIIDGLSRMKVQQVWVDQTGVGEKLFEDLRKERLRATINGVIFTRQFKEKAVNDIILLMQAGRVKYFNNKVLINQLHQLERKITQHGNVRFEHSKKNHDDIFWAIALALSKASHAVEFFGITGSKALL